MTVTATLRPDPGDPERMWYELNGTDSGTGIQFNNEEFGVHEDGTILDSEGCPLVESDWETIAVRNSVPA